MSTQSKPEVVCLGIMVADVMAKTVEKVPEPGKLDIFDQMELHPGGCAINTSIGLSKLGIKAGVIGKVGKDIFGDFLIKILKKYDVDTSGITYSKQRRTSFSFAMINREGERSFLHYTGANEDLHLEDINFELIKDSRVLHIAGFNLMPGFDGEPVANVLKQAKEYGITTSLDTAWNPRVKNWKEMIKPSLSYLDIILPSIEEARIFSEKEKIKDVAQFFLDRGVKIVGLKMGKEGCYIKTEKGEFSIPSYPVKVIDTSGAGDAFAAGFLAGLIKGWDLQKTGYFANAVGALCVQAVGCTAGVKNMEETLIFMDKFPLPGSRLSSSP